jgi:hypothetical protein
MTPEQFVKKIAQLRRFSFSQKNFKEFAEIAREERFNGFQRGEGPDGEKWQSLEPETIMRKRGAHKTTRVRKGEAYTGKVRSYQSRLQSALKKGSDTTSISPTSPLIDTGNLMKATTTATSTEGRVVLAKSRSMPVHNGKSISEIHDEGGGHVPKRRHWAIYVKAKERIEKRAQYLYEEEVKKHFR